MLLAPEAGVYGLVDLIERIAHPLHDVEIVEQDGRLQGVAMGGVAERIPHAHDSQTHAFCLFLPEKSLELVHALLAATVTAEPDRAQRFSRFR